MTIDYASVASMIASQLKVMIGADITVERTHTLPWSVAGCRKLVFHVQPFSAEKAHSGHEFYWQGSETCSQAEGCRSLFTSVTTGLSAVCAGTVTVFIDQESNEVRGAVDVNLLR